MHVRPGIISLVLISLAAIHSSAMAQQQEASAPNAAPLSTSNQPIYDMVAGDRETAWRINRLTGEVMICRLDTTGGLDTVRAQCARAGMEKSPQTSEAPGADRP